MYLAGLVAMARVVDAMTIHTGSDRFSSVDFLIPFGGASLVARAVDSSMICFRGCLNGQFVGCSEDPCRCCFEGW